MGFKSSGPVSKFGSGEFAVSQVTVGTAAISLVAANPDRREVILIKKGNKDIFLGEDGTVTTATGALFAGNKGAAFGIDTTDAIFGIAGSAGNDVDIIELIET